MVKQGLVMAIFFYEGDDKDYLHEAQTSHEHTNSFMNFQSYDHQ
jgi:hypothetical protein